MATELHSFQIPYLGSTAWAHLASHVQCQRKPPARMRVEQAVADSFEEAKNLVKLQQLCQEWEMNYICLTFEEKDEEF